MKTKNLIPVVEKIYKKTEGSKLSPSLIKSLKTPLKTISDFFEITETQAIWLSVVIIRNIEASGVSVMQVADHVGLEPAKMLNYLSDFNTLCNKNLLCYSNFRRRQTNVLGRSFRADYIIPEKVISSLFNGEKRYSIFNKKMTVPEILSAVQSLLNAKREEEINQSILLQEVKQMLEYNSSLEMVKQLKRLVSQIDEQIVFLLIANNKMNGNEPTDINDLAEAFFDNPNERYDFKRQIRIGSSPLRKNRLVCYEKEAFIDDRFLELDEKGKEIIYGDDAELFEGKKAKTSHDLLTACKIKEKQLFYNNPEQRRINQLTNILQPENFSVMEKRLADEGMPTGFNILFYGLPGTGKTETALQLSRITGRDMISVDISKTKSCWFGESEKLIKKVFEDYKKIVEASKLAPILLLNEADGIISKRMEIMGNSVDQTRNAIQNIILNEMETLKGILIATTNLTQNFDHAFERRFLYKIKFDKPCLQARMAIWKDKICWLESQVLETLANSFDFSGGQIENIARKASVIHLLEGRKPCLSELKDLCIEENIETERGKIGY